MLYTAVQEVGKLAMAAALGAVAVLAVKQKKIDLCIPIAFTELANLANSNLVSKLIGR